MITNVDMTIYNYWYNPDTKEWEYRPTQIKDVHWFTEEKVNVTDKGVVSGSMHYIRIPKRSAVEGNRMFVDANEFQHLASDKVEQFWTVSKEDLFVKGLLKDDVRNLASLRGHECGKVSMFSVNYIGFNPHIRIGGVA